MTEGDSSKSGLGDPLSGSYRLMRRWWRKLCNEIEQPAVIARRIRPDAATPFTASVLTPEIVDDAEAVIARLREGGIAARRRDGTAASDTVTLSWLAPDSGTE
jgi:hypothetical protein